MNICSNINRNQKELATPNPLLYLCQCDCVLQGIQELFVDDYLDTSCWQEGEKKKSDFDFQRKNRTCT